MKTEEEPRREESSPHVSGGTTLDRKAGDYTRRAMELLLGACGSRPRELREYHNPDPLSRLLGRRNESKIFINEQEVTSLLEGGAECSSISSEYCKEQGIPIYPLDDLLRLTGTGGHDIPYLGFCEVRVQVPHAPSFDEDTLMLVLPHNEYHSRVPVTLGTYTLDRVVAHSENDEDLDEAWKLVKESTLMALREQLGISLGDRLDLARVHSAVRTTKEVVIPPGKSVVVSGNTGFNVHHKRLHVITQSAEGTRLPAGLEACPAYTEMKPGSSRVKMILRNRSDQEMRVGARSVVGRMDAANAVPPALVPKEVTESENRLEAIDLVKNLSRQGALKPLGVSQPTQVGLEEERSPNEEIEEKSQKKIYWDPCQPLPPEELLGSGKPLKPRELTPELIEEMWSRVPKGELHSWTPELQKKAKELFVKWEHVIARDDLDLGHAATFKHDIVLTDPTPVKSRYRRIPPQNYEEVKNHLQEMLDMGVIQKSFSSWASPVVLARKKNGKLRFCVDLRGVNKKTQRDAHPIPRIEEKSQKKIYWDPCQPLPPEELLGSGKPLKPRELTPELIEEMWSRVPKGELHSWTPELQKKAKELFVKWEHVIARDDLDLGHAATFKHDIVLTDPTPVKSRYRRIPPQNYEEVKNHLQEMLDMGVIQKSFSSWASPVVLARKKNGKLRFCVDLRGVNKKTQRDAHPIPRIEETLDRLKGATIFSSIDLKCGFWEVEITDRAKPYTAFTCGPLGFYECARMPFGLTNAPATFQRLMESCLGDLHLQCCLIYLDDVIVFSSSPEEHLASLDKVFRRFAEAGLKIRIEKCNFFQSEVEYLGHVVSSEGVKPNRERIAAVQNWKVPTNLSELRSFLGFASYYRKFIKNFAKIARPLYARLSGEPSRKAASVKIGWDDESQEAFDILKRKVCEAPCLAFPDFTQPFLLKTDASGGGLGAVLYQIQEGKERVIAYASRSLQPAETRYPAYKLEFLALKWAVTEKLKDYLWGSKFVVYTDNNPLTYMQTTGKLDATTQRWVAALACYDFDIVYRAGKLNVEADALSRMVWPDEEEEVECVKMSGEVVSAMVKEARLAQVGAVSLAVEVEAVDEIQDVDEEGLCVDDWLREQRADPTLKRVLDLWKNGEFLKTSYDPTDSEDFRKLLKQKDHLRVREGVLFRKTKIQGRTFMQAVLPPKLRATALRGAHDQLGHLGRDKTLDILQERVWWPGMRRDVVAYISGCDRCLRFKASPERAPMEVFSAGLPMELVHIDFLKLEDGKEDRYRDVLVITDHFTGYAQAHVCTNQKAPLVAKVLMDSFFQHYGLPDKLISDQGANFESGVIQELCKLLGVQKIRTTPYHPQTNGSCERFNRTLIGMIGTLATEEKSKWPSSLKRLVHAYNSSVNRMTGFSPFFLMFGRSPRLPIDIELGLKMPARVKSHPTSTYVKNLKRKLNWAHKIAFQHREKSSGGNKKSYDKRVKCSKLEEGDACLVRTVAWSGKHKLQDRWDPGVYIVKKQPIPSLPVFTVRCEETGKEKTLHRNLLLPLRQGGQLVLEQERKAKEEARPAEDIPAIVKIQEEATADTVENDTTPTPGVSDFEPGEGVVKEMEEKHAGEESAEVMPIVDLNSDDEPVTDPERRYPRRERRKPNWLHRAWSSMTRGIYDVPSSDEEDPYPGLGGTPADFL